jgi:hypothetical protein
MTDYDKMRSLLMEFGIEYVTAGNTIRICDKEDKKCILYHFDLLNGEYRYFSFLYSH